jgi:16S rRNA processing protein RimM
VIGLAVLDHDGKPVGKVIAVENYGAGDLLEIELEGGRTSLIPFTRGIADLEDGRIVLDPEYLA